LEYSNLLAEHRAQAGRWLGLLHSGAASAAAQGWLPEAGPRRYLELVGEIRDLIEQHRDNPVLSPTDLLFIEEILARLDDLSAQWNRVEEICSAAPRTLVH